MDRKRALEILGLEEDATAEKIESRYDILFRKFRFSNTDGKGHSKEEVVEAYHILAGHEYDDPEAEQKRIKRLEHPNRILKLLGIDEEKAENFLYYHKSKLIIGVIGIIVLAVFIIVVANRTKPDLNVFFAGQIVIQDSSSLTDAIKNEIGAKSPIVQCISQTENSSNDKLSVELMDGGNDIFILDSALYEHYASLGLFQPLNDRLEQYGVESYDKALEVAVDNGDGTFSPKAVYGIDITNSTLLKNNGVMGGTMIAVLTRSGNNSENADAFLRALVKSTLPQGDQE